MRMPSHAKPKKEKKNATDGFFFHLLRNTCDRYYLELVKRSVQLIFWHKSTIYKAKNSIQLSYWHFPCVFKRLNLSSKIKWHLHFSISILFKCIARCVWHPFVCVCVFVYSKKRCNDVNHPIRCQKTRKVQFFLCFQFCVCLLVTRFGVRSRPMVQIARSHSVFGKRFCKMTAMPWLVTLCGKRESYTRL